MTENSRLQLLLDDYNYYRARTKQFHDLKRYYRLVKMNTAKEALIEFVEWADEHGIDARRWIHFRFACRKWIYAPPLWQLKPAKKKERETIERYQLQLNAPVFAHRISQQGQYQVNATGVFWDVNRDISSLAEVVKRRYVRDGQTSRCMEEMDFQTFGYHPKSRVCADCPARIQCEQITRSKVLYYDIIALRRGEIDLQTCYDNAAIRGQR